MIPGEHFSSETVKGQLYNPWSRDVRVSYHWGPIEIQDPSQGLGALLWECRAVGEDVLLSAPGVDESVWYTHASEINQVSLAFDQNGRPVIAFSDNDGGVFMRWFDPVPNEVVNMDLDAFDAVTPKVTLDDNRPFNSANSDVILGYVRDGYVRYRRQRDRFEDEYTPTVGPAGGDVEYLPTGWTETAAWNVYSADSTNMRDGDYTTGYAGANAINQYVRADLGSPQAVSKVVVAGGTFSGGGWGAVSIYLNGRHIQYSDDDSSWTTVAAVSGATDSSPYTAEITFSPIVARYWRLTNIVSGDSWLSTSELRFYGAVADGDPAPASSLKHISMNSAWRLEFLTDDSGDEPWTLAEVAADLLYRNNIADEEIDVGQLYNYIVDGYRVAVEGGADIKLGPLQQAHFFDPGEWDKKIRFVMRGGESVANITFDDLLERPSEDGPLTIDIVQQIELLRKVNVTMVDSTAGWISNKQTAERRSATIQAIGESSVVIPMTATPDFIAAVALKRLRIPWGEPNKFKFALGIPWSVLTPTDVVTLTDPDGRAYRMRLMAREEDYSRLSIESNTDAQWVYETTAKGVSHTPQIPTIPGQAGDTVAVPLNIPVIRDQDDEFGLYVAVYGTGNGWNGGTVQISLDGGATVAQTIQVDVPSIVGETSTAMLAEVSSEYLSSQVLRVTMPYAPESVSREAILRYQNLAAIERPDGSWELMQYQTVTPVDEITFDLSGLLRGRYATAPMATDVGARFVLIDTTIMFVQLQQWMLGQTISYRGVTNGQNPDDVDWETFVATGIQSQTEWPVHYVHADRDISDNVTVTWIGRGRLGVEIAPRNSKYFTGYRVTYSDGYTADVAPGVFTHTRASTPPSVTVTVAGINSITGLGPQSEGITL